MAETTIQALQRETEAARNLLAHMGDILESDSVLKQDTIEGETNLREAIESAARRILELEAIDEALQGTKGRLEQRLARLKAQRENLRTALVVAMELADIRRLETPTTTITLKVLPPKAEVTEEAAIPAKFWKAQPPKLNSKLLLEALRSKEEVPGAVLSNGGVTVQLSTG